MALILPQPLTKTLYTSNGNAWLQYENNRIIYAANYGKQFTNVNFVEGIIISMAFKDSMNGFALTTSNFNGAGSYKNIYETTNGGAIWDSLAANYYLEKPFGITAVKTSTNQNAYLVYGTDGAQSSFNDGATWQFVDPFIHYNMVAYDEKNMISIFRETGNGNNLRVFDSQLTAIKNNALFADGIKVYPNPVNIFLHVNLPQQTSSKIVFVLTDVCGKQLVYETSYNPLNQAGLINCQTLAGGVYVLQIYDDNILIKADKIIVSH